MTTFVLLTRLSPQALARPQAVTELERAVAERLEAQVPEAKWIGSYAILGPYDYLDIFEAPDETVATKVALIVRSFGHATTETWVATPWERFKELAAGMSE